MIQFWLRPTNFCLVWLNFSFNVYIHFQKLSQSLALRVLKLDGKSERGSKRSTDQGGERAIYINSMRENLVWMFSSDWFVWSVSIRKFDRKLSERLCRLLRLWITIFTMINSRFTTKVSFIFLITRTNQFWITVFLPTLFTSLNIIGIIKIHKDTKDTKMK